MTDPIPTYQSAEDLRKAKDYSAAAEQFGALWQQTPSRMVGWRYAFCLRKLGHVAEAEGTARAALENYPDDKFTKSELGWVLYDKELKPAKEDSDLGRTIHFAEEIARLNPDIFAVRLVTLAVMKVAKGRKKWDVVLKWANKLKAEDLSTEARTFDGKRGMSEREAWYVGRARALLELEQYADARTFAQLAIKEFPDELFLARTAALALARMGSLDQAADELRKLLNHRRADWYVKADLARLEHARGAHGEAFRLMCDALANSQDDEYKLKCFVALAHIALALDRIDVAAEHVALAKAVRTTNDWSIPGDLAQLEKAVQDQLATAGQEWPTLPTDADALSAICQRRWRDGKAEGLEFVRGTLGAVNPDKPYAFIARDDGGESVFVKVRDIPHKCVQTGARLEFSLKKSFDKKKNRDSTQATNVRCLKD